MVSRTLRSLALATMAIMIFSSAVSAGGPANFEEAQKLAADEGKLVLVDFFADWCGPCKLFDADSKSDVALKEGLQEVIVFKIDAEKGAGIELAARYGVRSYPNYLLADTSGEPIARWVGYDGPEAFLGTLNENLADPTTIAQKEARYEANPTAKDAASIASASAAGQDHVAAVAWYGKAAELEDGSQAEIFMATLYGMKSGSFTQDQLVAAADATMESGSFEDKALVYESQGYMAKMTGDETLAYRYVEDFWATLKDNDSPEMAMMRGKVEIDYAMHIEKDGAHAADLMFASMPEGWQAESKRLNGYAWWCYENQVDLERAESLARKGVELAAVGSEKAMILDTVAELCNSLGECNEAIVLIEMAIENDPENEYYQKQLVRFREIASTQG